MSKMEVVPSSCQCTRAIVSKYDIFVTVPKHLLFQLDAQQRLYWPPCRQNYNLLFYNPLLYIKVLWEITIIEHYEHNDLMNITTNIYKQILLNGWIFGQILINQV